MGFNDLQTTKIGNQGEEIFDNYLKNKNILAYKPIDENASHIIDRIVVIDGKNYAYDVKCKSHRDLYPDVCIDYSDYKKYFEYQEKNNIPVIIVFVDKKYGYVYGAKLNDLAKPYKNYPLTRVNNDENCIYFHMDKMKKIFDLEIRH